jgi:hypothetical protein
MLSTIVAEPLGVALNRVPVSLDSVLVLENPFTGVERILRSMKQAKLNDGFSVVAVLVKQLRHIWKRWLLAVLTPVTPVFDRQFLEAVLSDEDGEHLFFDVVFPVFLVSAIGAGTRLSQPRPVVATKSILYRFNEERGNERIERLFVRSLHTNRHGCVPFTPSHATAPNDEGKYAQVQEKTEQIAQKNSTDVAEDIDDFVEDFGMLSVFESTPDLKLHCSECDSIMDKNGQADLRGKKSVQRYQCTNDDCRKEHKFPNDLSLGVMEYLAEMVSDEEEEDWV